MEFNLVVNECEASQNIYYDSKYVNIPLLYNDVDGLIHKIDIHQSPRLKVTIDDQEYQLEA